MESDSTTTDFSLLPPHIIAKIFKFLNFRQRLSTARTCKAWYYASCDPLIWNHSRIRISDRIIRAEDFHRPFGKQEFSRIDFNKFTSYREYFSKFGQYIRELDFNYCSLSLQQLYDCLILTSNLTSLSIHINNDLLSSYFNLTDDQLDEIKLNLNSVKSFTIALNKANREWLQDLLGMMPQLENISLSTSDYYDDYIYGILFDYLNEFSTEINLNRLGIGDLAGNRAVEFFRDFMKIKQKLNVHELVLSSISGNIYDEEYDEHFDSFCRKLSSVRILSMHSIGQNQLNHVCSFMTELTEIRFSGMSNQDIKNIGSLRNLKKLTLNCSYHHNESENYLLGIFLKLRQLNELRLDYLVSERVLNEICVSCTNLTVLELYRVRTTNFAILFKNLLLLKKLYLMFWEPRLDFAVDYDITNLKLLEDLVISNFAPGMTIDLIEQLPSLQPKSLLNIRTKVQTGYVDPELEDTFSSIFDLFN